MRLAFLKGYMFARGYFAALNRFAKDEFDESKVKRDEEGKFAKKGASSSGASKKQPAKKSSGKEKRNNNGRNNGTFSEPEKNSNSNVKRKEGKVTKYYGKTPGGFTLKDRTVKGLSKEAQAAYNEICEKANRAVSDFVDISEGIPGAKLSGIEFCIKGGESVARKVKSRMTLDVNAGKSDTAVLKELGDLIRFTQTNSAENLVSTFNQTLKGLKNKGYNITEIDNKWLDPESVFYKGIHVTIEKDGQKMELQFHTPKNIDIKEGNLHKFYEERRKIPKNTKDQVQIDRRKELGNLMKQEVKKFEKPKGVESIPVKTANPKEIENFLKNI